VHQECHIFESEEGAKEAYAWMVARARASPPSTRLACSAMGNESAAFVADVGTIGNSPVVATFHQVIFRRGNVVSIVVNQGRPGPHEESMSHGNSPSSPIRRPSARSPPSSRPEPELHPARRQLATWHPSASFAKQQPLLVLLAGLTLMAMALSRLFLLTGNNGGGLQR
jgi:hypothetical protein